MPVDSDEEDIEEKVKQLTPLQQEKKLALLKIGFPFVQPEGWQPCLRKTCPALCATCLVR